MSRDKRACFFHAPELNRKHEVSCTRGHSNAGTPAKWRKAMSKQLVGNQKGYINSNKAVNESISAVDKEYMKALTSPILVIETNSPSSQALKSFSLKLIQIKARLHGEVK